MKKSLKLSQISEETLSVIKYRISRAKGAKIIVADIAWDLSLSWGAAFNRVKTLIKAKKIARNKKGEITLK